MAAGHVPTPVTRLITTHDTTSFNGEGEPNAIFHPRSGPAEWKQISPASFFNLIYTTQPGLPDLNGDADIAAHDQVTKEAKLVLDFPGTVCRMVEWAPIGEASDGKNDASPEAAALKDAMNSFMHRTQSIDYGIVVKGESMSSRKPS